MKLQNPKSTILYLSLMLSLLLLLGIRANAQVTATISGTTTDINGQAYALGNYTIEYIRPQNGSTPLYITTGLPVAPLRFSGNLDAAGAFTGIVVTKTTQIAPGGGLWKFTICSLATSGCFSYSTSITGNVDLSAALSGASYPIAVVASSDVFRIIPRAYQDSEVSGQVIGSWYYNITNTVPKWFDGTNWNSLITSGTLATNNSWTGLNTYSQFINILSGTQAKQVSLSAVVPQGLAIQQGTQGVPVATYQTKPSLYLSRWSNSDQSGCITGMAAPCLDPIMRIDAANENTTTTGDLTGLIVNMWGAKANTSPATWGNQWIGGAFMMADSTTVNKVNMTGLNPNITGVSTPATCFKGAAGTDPTCARSMNGLEIDVSNGTAIDGVTNQQIGNFFSGLTIGCYSTNATLSNCSSGFAVGTGNAGHGFWIGGNIGGSKQVGLLIAETGISLKPEIGIHIASQGGTGITIGTGSTTYAHNVTDTFANPTIGILYDAKRLEGAVGLADSNNTVWRAATGAATYSNWKEFNANSGFMHWQTDISGSYADAMVYAPNVVPANSSLAVTGIGTFTGAVYVKNTGATAIILTGTPTANRTKTFNDTDGVIVERDTVDTLTNKSLTSPTIITGIAANGSGLKHKRGTAGCATAAAAGAVCTTTVTWNTTFADANYTATCTGDVITSGVPLAGGLTAKLAASVTFQTVAGTAAAAQYTNIECMAVHD